MSQYAFALLLFLSTLVAQPQTTPDYALEKMPADLERDYALSALPPHLRKDATVYLLDPAKGYYIAHQGTNGFMCFVNRTDWAWGEFRKDLATPISFDAEGARAIFPVDRDVAAMRATGKFTAQQIKDIVIDRIHKGVYKAPGRAGISYMLSPLMRVYPGDPNNNEIVTMSMPHYMYYAPYISESDIGSNSDGPIYLNNPGSTVLGKGKGPYGYIIFPAGEKEADKIVKANSDLLKRLAAYKPYYKLKPNG
jgi:hypothetical protein